MHIKTESGSEICLVTRMYCTTLMKSWCLFETKIQFVVPSLYCTLSDNKETLSSGQFSRSAVRDLIEGTSIYFVIKTELQL